MSIVTIAGFCILINGNMFLLGGKMNVRCLLLLPSRTAYTRVHKMYRKEIVNNKFIKQPNPGIQKQLEIYKDSEPFDKADPISENFEDELESDFTESNNMFDQHRREQRHHNELRRLQNVGRKYFKEKKMPNLLTWGEKEQIRYLYDSDPEEWSVERLAVSFPASEAIIKKVLNSSWKPESAVRIQKHDDNVRKNWALLSKGKLDISPDLKARVSKFTSREDSITAEGNAVIASPQKPRGRVPEFENIIKQYNDLVGEKDEIKNENQESFSNDKCLPYSRLVQQKFTNTGKRHVTFNEYKGYPTSKSEVSEVQGHDPENPVIELEPTSMVKFQANNVSVKKHPFSIQLERISNLSVVEKILIPKNKWQAGATYKLKDCYYDDDGRFLYRVPGMVHQ